MKTYSFSTSERRNGSHAEADVVELFLGSDLWSVGRKKARAFVEFSNDEAKVWQTITLWQTISQGMVQMLTSGLMILNLDTNLNMGWFLLFLNIRQKMDVRLVGRSPILRLIYDVLGIVWLLNGGCSHVSRRHLFCASRLLLWYLHIKFPRARGTLQM
jgi:hypothetical protein